MSRNRFSRLVLSGLATMAAIATFAPSAAAAQPVGPSDYASIDAYVQGQMTDAHLPGMALGLVHDGQVVHVRGFGRANPAGDAVTPTTPFVIGSVSKSFTALAVMQLVETGQVSLDAPAVDYVSDFRLADAADSNRITVRQLLNQTSGIPTEAGIDPLTGPVTSLDAQVRSLSAVNPATTPGAAFAYSNANYEVLGRLIEDVSGLSYGSYLQDRILTPLGMTDTFTSVENARAAGLAGGCRIWFGVANCLAPGTGFRPDFVPAGFVMSSVQDMSRYLVAQLSGQVEGGKGILSPADFALMHAPAANAGLSAQGGSYGMGWFIGPRAGIGKTIWHDGSAAASHSMVLLLPDTGWGIVILTNAESLLYSMVARIDVIADGIAARLAGTPEPGTLSGLYYAFDAIVVLFAALQLRTFVRLARRPAGMPSHKSRFGFWLAEIALPIWRELIVPIGILVGLPAILGAPWVNLAGTDVGAWLLGFAIFLLLTGGFRLYRTRTAWLPRLRGARRRPAVTVAAVAN